MNKISETVLEKILYRPHLKLTTINADGILYQCYCKVDNNVMMSKKFGGNQIDNYTNLSTIIEFFIRDYKFTKNEHAKQA